MSPGMWHTSDAIIYTINITFDTISTINNLETAEGRTGIQLETKEWQIAGSNPHVTIVFSEFLQIVIRT